MRTSEITVASLPIVITRLDRVIHMVKVQLNKVYRWHFNASAYAQRSIYTPTNENRMDSPVKPGNDGKNIRQSIAQPCPLKTQSPASSLCSLQKTGQSALQMPRSALSPCVYTGSP
ncbi:hypothetical protein [Litorimonas sp.]|uniref:hypothetical protein n=1 Tax=Litorimonas sp. TaxID=1892381 RepID=UPI003A89B858